MRSPGATRVGVGLGTVSGGGGSYVKNRNRFAFDRSHTEALSTDKLKSRSNKKFVLLAASAAICWAAFAFAQPVQAETFGVEGIKSTLPAWSATKSEQATADDSAISTLNSFAQQIATETPSAAANKSSQPDDEAIAALRGFAQRLGTEQPASTKDQVKLAQADTLMDWLAGKGSSAPAAPPPVSTPAPKASRSGKRTAAPVEAHVIGSQACQTCHAPLIAEFQKTIMGQINTSAKGRGKFECENCHGPGSAHVQAGGGRGVGGILSFGADDPRSVDERNGICLACHQRGQRTYWSGSVHQTRDLACTDCHTVMRNVSRKHNLKTTVEAETCFYCHDLKRAQVQYSSHMPVREGKLTCSSCHNPHGTATEKLIIQASINDNCYQCHAEKRGPYMWEHAPVRENCLNCHVAHGSNYEYLLQVARPRLCNECHSVVHSPTATGGLGFPNTPYVLGRACGNCHSNIHGSNHPNGVYFLR